MRKLTAFLTLCLLANGFACAVALPILAEAPSFTLTDTTGSPFSSDALRGKVWVGYFFFSTCSGPCPIMNRQMAEIAREFADMSGVAFVGFSVDPTVDTPQRLAEYGKQFGADPGKWHMLTGPLDEITKIGVALKVGAADQPIFHSTRFILVDAQGRVRGYHTGTEADGVASLKRDLHALLGPARPVPSKLPTTNAILNAIAALFLIAGRMAIKSMKSRELHQRMMTAAFLSSVLFLVFYLYYHAQTGARTPYHGEGAMRLAYYAILMTHIPLAGLMVPFILAALYFAWRGQFERHVRVVRWLWPVWMYVSATGVLIYLMLYRF